MHSCPTDLSDTSLYQAIILSQSPVTAYSLYTQSILSYIFYQIHHFNTAKSCRVEGCLQVKHFLKHYVYPYSFAKHLKRFCVVTSTIILTAANTFVHPLSQEKKFQFVCSTTSLFIPLSPQSRKELFIPPLMKKITPLSFSVYSPYPFRCWKMGGYPCFTHFRVIQCYNCHVSKAYLILGTTVILVQVKSPAELDNKVYYQHFYKHAWWTF